MNLLERLKSKARTYPQRVVLPEGEDERVIRAAARVTTERYAKIVLLGRSALIRATADRAGVTLDGVEIVDPASNARLNTYADIYFDRRQSRGLTRGEAQDLASKPLYFAALSVAAGDADATVGGATNSTSDTVRAALHSIGLAPDA